MATEWWPHPYTEADWRAHALSEDPDEPWRWLAYCDAHRGQPGPWEPFAEWAKRREGHES